MNLHLAYLLFFLSTSLNFANCMLWRPNGEILSAQDYVKQLYANAVRPDDTRMFGANSHNILGQREGLYGDKPTKTWKDAIKAAKQLSRTNGPAHFYHDLNELPGQLRVQKFPDGRTKEFLRVTDEEREAHHPDRLKLEGMTPWSRHAAHRKYFAPNKQSVLKHVPLFGAERAEMKHTTSFPVSPSPSSSSHGSQGSPPETPRGNPPENPLGVLRGRSAADPSIGSHQAPS